MPPKKTVPTIANRLSATPVADRFMRMVPANQRTKPAPFRPTVAQYKAGITSRPMAQPPSQAILDYTKQIGRSPTMAELEAQGLLGGQVASTPAPAPQVSQPSQNFLPPSPQPAAQPTVPSVAPNSQVALANSAPATSGMATLPATPPPGFNQNTAARHTYGFGAGGPGQGNANLLNEVLARHGINSDLSVQPRQNLDAAAQLQGRLTASGAPFTRPTHQSFNVDGQPAPFVNPFGTTAQKMERGAGSGTLRGGSTVTVDDSGRAVVRGTDTYGPRGLAKFGIVNKVDTSKMSPEEEAAYRADALLGFNALENVPMKRDYSGQHARLAANRRRMENVLASRRLGVENPLPSAPIAVGTEPEDVLAALSTQQDNSGRLQNMLSLRNQGDTGWRQGTPQAELNRQQFDKQEQLAQSQQKQAQDLETTMKLIEGFAPAIANGSMTPADVLAWKDQVLGNTPVGEGLGGEMQQQLTRAKNLVSGMTDGGEIATTLTREGFSPEVIKKTIAAMGLTPNQENQATLAARSEQISNNPNVRYNPNPPLVSAPARDRATRHNQSISDAYSWGGY